MCRSHPGDKGSQSGERVAPGSTNSNEHAVTSLGGEDTIDPSNVDHSVLEEHDVHLDGLRSVIVLLELVNQVSLKLSEVNYLFVDTHFLIE